MKALQQARLAADKAKAEYMQSLAEHTDTDYVRPLLTRWQAMEHDYAVLAADAVMKGEITMSDAIGMDSKLFTRGLN